MRRNPQRESRAETGGEQAAEAVPALDKIARLLGILATKDIAQKTEQAVFLRGLGFSVSEVASMLRMTENHVRVATHHGRRKPRAKKSRARD